MSENLQSTLRLEFWLKLKFKSEFIQTNDELKVFGIFLCVYFVS